MENEKTDKNAPLGMLLESEGSIDLEDVEDVRPHDIELEHLKDKAQIMSALDKQMRLIYIAALIMSKPYMNKYKSAFGTEDETILRPQIRFRPGRAVEIAWVKRVTTWHTPTQEAKKAFREKRNSKDGRKFSIVNVKGQDKLIVSKFEFIKRETVGLKYPNSIFDNAPAWVSMMGGELEEQFATLRKETEVIRKIRLNLKSIDVTHEKIFKQLGDKRAQLNNTDDD